MPTSPLFNDWGGKLPAARQRFWHSKHVLVGSRRFQLRKPFCVFRFFRQPCQRLRKRDDSRFFHLPQNLLPHQNRSPKYADKAVLFSAWMPLLPKSHAAPFFLPGSGDIAWFEPADTIPQWNALAVFPHTGGFPILH